jgi:putative FmdB family regulatory protein
MPIYAYGCSSCGLKKDVMQKMNDAPLHTCPECGKETFTKQLTAAGFQLKGSGYYAPRSRRSSQMQNQMPSQQLILTRFLRRLPAPLLLR